MAAPVLWHKRRVDRARLEIVDASGATIASGPCAVGDKMLDVCDDVRGGVPFGCRNASCGSCVVDVIEGADALEPPSRLELSVLRHHAVGTADRLACRAAFGAPGTVRIRARRTATT